MNQYGWACRRVAILCPLLILLIGVPASLSVSGLSGWTVGGRTVFQALISLAR